MSSGDFTNNAADEITKVTPEKPEEAEGTSVALSEPEYPSYADEMVPNLKHLCIKAGYYNDLVENKDKFLNNELLWCVDNQRLYIKS
jgi:hypothetical protein